MIFCVGQSGYACKLVSAVSLERICVVESGSLGPSVAFVVQRIGGNTHTHGFLHTRRNPPTTPVATTR